MLEKGKPGVASAKAAPDEASAPQEDFINMSKGKSAMVPKTDGFKL